MKRTRALWVGGICVIVIIAALIAAFWSRYRTSQAETRLATRVEDIRLRAERGETAAEAELGSAFLYGQVVGQDDAQAFHWYQESAQRGDPSGLCGLGWMYMHGRGVPQDNLKAIQYYKAGADKGSASCQNGLGYFYAEGLGVPRDYGVAFRWYRLAAEQGYAKAEYNLGNMYFYGTGVPRDPSEASRWFRKAANQGDQYAQQAMAPRLTASRIYFLLLETIAGMLLALQFFFAEVLGPRLTKERRRGRLLFAAGLVCMFSAGLGWFGYKHGTIWSGVYGLNGFTLVLWALHAAVLVLLLVALLSQKVSLRA